MANRFLTHNSSPWRASRALPRLFARSDVEEDPEHDAADDAVVGALPSSGNPPNLIAVQYAEVDLVKTHGCPGRGEGGSHPLEIGGMNARR